jgi:hypothetical protein
MPNQWVELPGGRFISEKDPGWLVGATSAAVVTALFAAGTWSFHVMIAPPPGP